MLCKHDDLTRLRELLCADFDAQPYFTQEQVDFLEDRMQQVVALLDGSAGGIRWRHGRRPAAEDAHAADGEDTLQLLQGRLADMERRLSTQAAGPVASAARGEAQSSWPLHAGDQPAAETGGSVRTGGGAVGGVPAVHAQPVQQARPGWVHEATDINTGESWDASRHGQAVADDARGNAAARSGGRAHRREAGRLLPGGAQQTRAQDLRQSGEAADPWARPAAPDGRAAPTGWSSVEERDELRWQARCNGPAASCAAAEQPESSEASSASDRSFESTVPLYLNLDSVMTLS